MRLWDSRKLVFTSRNRSTVTVARGEKRRDRRTAVNSFHTHSQETQLNHIKHKLFLTFLRLSRSGAKNARTLVVMPSKEEEEGKTKYKNGEEKRERGREKWEKPAA